MKVVVPMAGLGTRFAAVAHLNPEYQKPKPFIRVRDVPMVRWATGSLMYENLFETKDLIFVVLRAHDQGHGMADRLRELYNSDVGVVVVDDVTRGAAETAFAARDLVDENESLIVSDSDHYFDGTNFCRSVKEVGVDGLIPVFRPPNDGIARWSYSLLDDEGFVVRVGEKDEELMRSGAWGNIGAYFFRKAKYFFDAVRGALKNNEMSGATGKQEFFVAPMFNSMIDKGLKVRVVPSPGVYGLGTPADLERFLQETNYQLNL